MLGLARVLVLTTLLSCAPAPLDVTAPRPVTPAPAPSHVPPAPLELDSLPGSAAELSDWLRNPTSAADVPRALLRLASLRLALLGTRDDAVEKRDVARLLVRLAVEHRAFFERERVDRMLSPLLTREQELALQRALVCPARFPYVPAAGGDPAALADAEQDRPVTYWNAWSALHQQTVAHDRRGPRARLPKAPEPTGRNVPRSWVEATRYQSPYVTCPHETSAARAEQWLRVAELEERSEAAGPFQPRRSADAAQRARDIATPGSTTARLALHRLAHAEYLSQRPEAAFRAALDFLASCDERTCGSALIADALILAADAVTFADFAGAAADEPAVVVRDRLTIATEADWRAAEKDARRRLDDPRLLPPDHPFAAELRREVAVTLSLVVHPGADGRSRSSSSASPITTVPP